MYDLIDATYCSWDSAKFLIFSDNVFGNFIYYSHLFPAIAVLILGTFVFFQNKQQLANRALFFLAIIFSFWSFFDLILWATEKPEFTMFFWSTLIYLDIFIYIGALYFIYAFISGAYPNWKQELIIALLLIPLILLAHTHLNLTLYDYTNCWREAWEGPLWFYTYLVELVIALWILCYGVFKWFKIPNKRQQIALVTSGIVFFLISFSLGNITGSIEIDWELGQYGLFGMPIFLSFLAYLMVKYHSLDVRVIGAEVMVVAIGILIASMLFIRKVENVQIIAVITLLLTSTLGILLVRSVKREIKQRKEIELLAEKLQYANKRLRELDQLKSEFVSIASHQLRSPLTSIRGYASMIMEGSYGSIPKKALEAITRIHDSSRFMALTVEDFLNVSRIEAGKMKYELSDFSLLELAEKVSDDLRQSAMQRGLLLVFRSDCVTKGTINADIGKTRQVLHNMIDNAMKYTPKGSIHVIAHDNKRKKEMYITIVDTGIGMPKDSLEHIFDKFVRAKGANSVNVTGSGLGLYVARQMVRSMGGDITAESEGKDKGSKFTISFPLSSAKK